MDSLAEVPNLLMLSPAMARDCPGNRERDAGPHHWNCPLRKSIFMMLEETMSRYRVENWNKRSRGWDESRRIGLRRMVNLLR
jgi:hypothetical protein